MPGIRHTSKGYIEKTRKHYENMKTTQVPSPAKQKGGKSDKFQVRPYCVNQGTTSQYFGLMAVEGKEKWVLRYAPNNWKTERGAVNWARKHGYNVTVNGKKVKSSVRNSRKTKKKIKKMLSK